MSKRKILKQQCKEIIQLNPTERVWQMPFFFALAVGFALSIAAYYDRMDLGLIAMIGIMAFVYTTNTPMYHRMAVTMCCSFGLCLSFLIGLCTHFFPAFSPLVVGLVAMASSILIRYYNIGAPGYFFFVFSCLLASFFPFPPKDYIFLVGLICIGGIIANITAFLYSVSVIYIFKNSPPKPVLKNGNLGFDVIFVDSIIIAFFVGFAVFLGTFLELDRSYWVAVSTTGAKVFLIFAILVFCVARIDFLNDKLNQFAQNSFTLTPLKNIGSFIMNQSLTTSSLGQIDQNLQDIRDDLSTTQGE